MVRRPSNMWKFDVWVTLLFGWGEGGVAETGRQARKEFCWTKRMSSFVSSRP